MNFVSSDSYFPRLGNLAILCILKGAAGQFVYSPLHRDTEQYVITELLFRGFDIYVQFIIHRLEGLLLLNIFIGSKKDRYINFCGATQ